MIRSSHFFTLTALTVVLLGGALVSAQGPGFGGLGRRAPVVGPGGPGTWLPLPELNLTDAQQQHVRQLAEQFREQTRALVEQARKGEEARRAAVEAIPVDEGRIRAAMQQLGEAQTDLAVQQARLHSEIYGLLTPEQQQQAQKLRADRQARLKQRQDRLQQRLQQRGSRPQA
ncbi:MAG TPA: Spy/CpxP family protein refolding chaperone [Vicinamibacterales bacterium]